jgi:hypothetical protein
VPSEAEIEAAAKALEGKGNQAHFCREDAEAALTAAEKVRSMVEQANAGNAEKAKAAAARIREARTQPPRLPNGRCVKCGLWGCHHLYTVAAHTNQPETGQHGSEPTHSEGIPDEAVEAAWMALSEHGDWVKAEEAEARIKELEAERERDKARLRAADELADAVEAVRPYAFGRSKVAYEQATAALTAYREAGK